MAHPTVIKVSSSDSLLMWPCLASRSHLVLGESAAAGDPRLYICSAVGGHCV